MHEEAFRRSIQKKHSEEAFSRQHSAISQTRATTGSALLHEYRPIHNNERAIHFSIDSKQKVKYHHSISIVAGRHLWRRPWNTSVKM
jgi:hypothetical protein